MKKVEMATPLSTLFGDNDMSAVLKNSDALEVRDLPVRSQSPLPRLYHSEFSIVVPWGEEVHTHIKEIIERENPELVSFHVLCDYEKPEVREGKFWPAGKKMEESEMLINTEANMAWMRKTFGERTYLIENNNFFGTGAYEQATSADFLKKVMERGKLKWLLDIGHAEITAKHTNVPFEKYLNDLGLEQVRQIHLSGITRGAEAYADSHNALSEEDWQNFRSIAPQCPNLRYVTIEYYRDAEGLSAMAERLKKEIAAL